MGKFFKGFVYAAKGLRYAFETQLNFKLQCGIATISILLGFFLEIARQDWLWLVLAIALMLIAELLNTAIEVLVDMVSPSYHTLAGIVKDVAAGAALVAALFALVVAGFVFTPKILGYVG